MINEDALDNPVWNALTDKHFNESISYDSNNIKFYKTAYAPFGAFINNEDTSIAIEKHALSNNDFFMVGNKPKMPSTLKPPIRYIGLQMILYNKSEYPISEPIIELNQKHYQDLMGLIKIAFPDYFKEKTNTLGRYYGIYKDKKLIAVTGERMSLNNFTEISAVATHPDFLGKGYAKQLVAHASNKIFENNKTPFLHVDETNLGAINLYKKLDFVARRKLDFWRITS